MSTTSYTAQTTPPANPIIRMDQDIIGVGTDSGTQGVEGQESDRPGIIVDVKDSRNNLKKDGSIPGESEDKEPKPAEKGDKSGRKLSPRDDLTRQEKAKIRELRAREREVRAHEMAHLTAARQYAQGGPDYTYERGPDGKRYIVSGSVNFDTSNAETPEETIEKMKAIKRAALAPAQPSQQDRKVASQAERTLREARQKMNRKESDDSSNQGSQTTAPSPASESLQPNERSSENDRRIGDSSEFSDEPTSERPAGEQTKRSISGVQNLRVRLSP
jgi:hypothetical protein